MLRERLWWGCAPGEADEGEPISLQDIHNRFTAALWRAQQFDGVVNGARGVVPHARLRLYAEEQDVRNARPSRRHGSKETA
jgi:hypothetical protein